MVSLIQVKLAIWASLVANFCLCGLQRKCSVLVMFSYCKLLPSVRRTVVPVVILNCNCHRRDVRPREQLTTLLAPQKGFPDGRQQVARRWRQARNNWKHRLRCILYGFQ